MIATALHSIATGNLLPAWVKVVCVDINPATVTKLSDRGTFQTIGLVTDVEPFLRSLAAALAGEQGVTRRSQASAITAIIEGDPRHGPDPANLDVSARLLRDRVRDQPLDEPRRSAATRPSRAGSGGRCTTRLIDLGVTVELLEPVPGLPDLVFTANAGLVYRRPVHQLAVPLRRPAGRDAPLRPLGRGARVRGRDAARRAATSRGPATPSSAARRSSPATGSAATRGATSGSASALGVEVLPLELVDPRFYHLDTCFCPLAEDAAIYYPGAFDDYGRSVLRDRIAQPDRGLGRGGRLVQLQRRGRRPDGRS